jgi:hypothetical protein
MNCDQCSKVSRMFQEKERVDRQLDNLIVRHQRNHRNPAPEAEPQTPQTFFSTSSGLPFHGVDRQGGFWVFPTL